MKKTFLNLSLFTTAMLISNSAFAYKFVIYTDEAVTNKSEQVAEIMKTTYPLNKFDIEVEIVRVPASEVIHVIDPVEGGQLRGVSKLTPAIVKLFLLDQYDDAELDLALDVSARWSDDGDAGVPPPPP